MSRRAGRTPPLRPSLCRDQTRVPLQALAPTYRLLWGVPGRSNALNIAARLGLEAEPLGGWVLGRAREILGSGQAVVQTAIVELEAARRRQEEEESRAEAAGRELVRKRPMVGQLRRDLVERRAQADLKDREAMLSALRSARRQVEQAKRGSRQRAEQERRDAEKVEQEAKKQARGTSLPLSGPGPQSRQCFPPLLAGGACAAAGRMVPASRRDRFRPQAPAAGGCGQCRGQQGYRPPGWWPHYCQASGR